MGPEPESGTFVSGDIAGCLVSTAPDCSLRSRTTDLRLQRAASRAENQGKRRAVHDRATQSS